MLISRLKHRNLVKLLGCCVEGEERKLIYEFMPNKSLDNFLFDPTKRAELCWSKRFSIIQGVARRLLYLHRDSCLRVIHRDMKVSNILLDGKMNSKISDFGLARMFEGTQYLANTHKVVGTLYVPNPVLGIIDVQPKELGIPTKAYYTVEEVKENATQKSQKVFVHVPSEIAAHEVEEIGVEHLLRDVKDTTISTLATEMLNKEHERAEDLKPVAVAAAAKS